MLFPSNQCSGSTDLNTHMIGHLAEHALGRGDRLPLGVAHAPAGRALSDFPLDDDLVAEELGLERFGAFVAHRQYHFRRATQIRQ